MHPVEGARPRSRNSTSHPHFIAVFTLLPHLLPWTVGDAAAPWVHSGETLHRLHLTWDRKDRNAALEFADGTPFVLLKKRFHSPRSTLVGGRRWSGTGFGLLRPVE